MQAVPLDMDADHAVCGEGAGWHTERQAGGGVVDGAGCY